MKKCPRNPHISAFWDSDILCSPRNFGQALILKACIDFSLHLFGTTGGIQNLIDETSSNFESYSRFILALFKKRFANKIKQKPDELFCSGAMLAKNLKTVRQEVWLYTLENNTVLPSKECLELRGKNLAFQLKIWAQATSTSMNIPDPLTHGWEKTEDGHRLIPDSRENKEKRENIFKTTMKKCKCKKTGCKNGGCACFNAKMSCSSFCECLNCTNPHSKEKTKPREDSDSDESHSEGESDEVQSDVSQRENSDDEELDL